MTERKGAVTLQEQPLTLMGPELKPGDPAPDVELLDTELKPVHFSEQTGKIRLIASVPSLDTPICDTETRKFNQAVLDLGENVIVYTVSADLPFAQARWCGAAGIERVHTLSDHRAMSFGDAYGVHIKELRLESRAVFVVDGKGIIRYCEYVPEIKTEPNYDAALTVVKELVSRS